MKWITEWWGVQFFPESKAEKELLEGLAVACGSTADMWNEDGSMIWRPVSDLTKHLGSTRHSWADTMEPFMEAAYGGRYLEIKR